MTQACVIWLPPQILAFPSTTSHTFLSMLPPLWPFSRCATFSCHRTFSYAIPSVWIMLLPLYYLPIWLLSSYNKSLSFTSSWHMFWLLLFLSFLALIMVIIFHLLVMIGECLAFLLSSSSTRSWIMSVFINLYASSPKQKNTIVNEEICVRGKIAYMAL